MQGDFELILNINKEQWSNFVANHPNGNIFQTPEIYEVYKRTKNYEPIALALKDSSGNIQALLLAHVIREFDGLLGKFSSRSIIQGGPLFLESQQGMIALNVLIKEYDKIVKRKTLYTEIRNINDTNLHRHIFEKMGYKYEAHLNYLHDLTETKEEMLARLSKSRRRFIRKAIEKGVTIEELTDRGLISEFYELLLKTYKHAKIPLADISFFESAFDLLRSNNLIRFFLAKHNNEYIGGIMTPIYKGVITEWYVTGSRDHSKLYPSDLISWYPLEWGSEKGYDTFDFGGAGKPDEEYGVREFKKQFGGKLVSYGRYKKIYSPIKMRIAMDGFKAYRRLF